MERSKDNAVVRILAPTIFDDEQLDVLEYEGRPMWSARQVNKALEYADPSDLTRRVNDDWADEFEEGVEYIVFRGETLAEIKSLAPHLVEGRAPSLMMLTRSGVNIACLLSKQPKGAALRRCVGREVLPAIQETGSYTRPGAAPATPQLGQRTPLPLALSKSPFGLINELRRAEDALGEDLPGIRHALYVLRPGSIHLPPIDDAVAMSHEHAERTALTKSPPARPQKVQRPAIAGPRPADFAPRDRFDDGKRPNLEEAIASLWAWTDDFPERSIRITVRKLADWWQCSFFRVRNLLNELRERGWVQFRWGARGERGGSLLIVVTSASGWPGRGGAR